MKNKHIERAKWWFWPNRNHVKWFKLTRLGSNQRCIEYRDPDRKYPQTQYKWTTPLATDLPSPIPETSGRD